MFESAEIGHQLDKATYKAALPGLREQLLECQLELLERGDTAVVVVIAGVEGAGKGETVNLLNEWMDPRHIETQAFGPRSEEEKERPPMWRFWRALPPTGKIGILFGSWYTAPILDQVLGDASDAELNEALQRIRHFERMLARENVLLIKLWFHLSRDTQKKRLGKLEKDKQSRWRVTERDWQLFHKFDRFYQVSEQVLRETSTAEAPWHVIDGTDHRYRSLTAGRLLLDAMRRRLDHLPGPPTTPPAPLPQPALDGRNTLNGLDYSLSLDKQGYRKALAHWQQELNRLSRDRRLRDRSVVLVFEGNDAAGKGGAIRRLTAALDARYCRVVPVAAPTDEERRQPYLWRFWRQLPRHGHFTVFDRSWYGRVLVERVEGLCSEQDWMRAYSEINEFEEQLVDSGVVLCKFWLAITPDEQLARFRARQETGYKRFKITDEDWRNREKWPEYERAVCDMVERTSTEYAPWKLVPANSKRFARIEVLKTVCTTLEVALSVR